jgi:pimeloyl-ACP methyl ester carboxylesterase
MRRGFPAAIALCLFVSLTVLTSGCGGPDDASRLASDDDGTLLSVVMAGNNSCHEADGVRRSPRGASLYRDFSTLIAGLQQRRSIRSNYVVTCYSLSSQLYVANSDMPEDIEAIDESTLPDYIRSFQEAHGDGRVLWIGHSYGGWLAMKTLLSFSDDARTLPRTTLFTIDPISRRTCSASRWLGCSSAPTDISESEYAQLGSKVDHWVNFFQRRTPVVRSSAVKGAQRNVELGVGHTSIDNHPRVWGSIAERLGG